jgi:predicted AlkP superfamily phosphohydrolase/phosphomutase
MPNPMGLFKKKSRPRVCVIGLDGVPYGLLSDLARRGVMPAVARLIASGHLHKLKASLPEISAVSWTDFMTGADSGTHGVFGFTDFKPSSYGLRFPNFADVQAPTFWDDLGRRGRRSIIINQPSTYPARPLNGILVSGFVAVDFDKAVFPASCRAPLKEMGYQIDIDTLRAREDRAFLWEELDRTLAGRRLALDYFWREDWDYFELVVTGTDRLHHFLWSAGGNDNHPDHARFLDYYRRVDGLIERAAGAFRGLTGGDDGLFLLSDHGFCGIEQEVYLNAWLEREGYLSFSTDRPQGLEDVSENSAAFVLDPGRIYVHRRGRFPRGSVAESEAGSVLEEIAGRLARLEHEGRKVIRRVFRASEVYSGPLTSRGPDLVVLSEPGFDLKGSVKKKEVFGRTDLEGMHTWDDAFFWANRPAGDDLAIRDLSGIIMGSFD